MKQLYVFGTVFIMLSLIQVVWNMMYTHACENRDDNTPDKLTQKRDFLINFGRRLKIGWGLFLIGVLPFCFGYVGITIFFALVAFLALREFVSIIHLKASDYWPIFCSFYIFLPIQFFFVLTDVPFLFYIFIPVYVVLLSPMISAITAMSKDADAGEQFFERAAKFQWAQIACIYCISYIPAIAGLSLKKGEFESSTLLLFFIIVLFSSDTFQYVFGNLFGKKKIAPNISPNKTWEGLIWGVIIATLIGTAMWWLTPFTWWQAGLLSIMLSIVGFIGGLIMSGIKRSLKIKDWSDLLGSHGGILDRLDSMIYTAPLFYHICKYFFS